MSGLFRISVQGLPDPRTGMPVIVPQDAGKEKALEPLGSKAFSFPSELVGATGFEPATLRPPEGGSSYNILIFNGNSTPPKD